jgi:Adenylate and Guanylate cyclase catalytic domain
VRGHNARFQLFGDTMNVASRIESSGTRDKIHLSRDTALLLKPHIVIKREDIVTLKGKGEQETYWYNFQRVPSEGSRSTSSESNGNTTNCPEALMDMEGWEEPALHGVLGKTIITSTTERLVLWNVEILKPILGSLIAKRSRGTTQSDLLSSMVENEDLRHEVQVVITMERFNALKEKNASLSDASVPAEVEEELRLYVATIASGYPKNPCTSAIDKSIVFS